MVEEDPYREDEGESLGSSWRHPISTVSMSSELARRYVPRESMNRDRGGGSNPRKTVIQAALAGMKRFDLPADLLVCWRTAARIQGIPVLFFKHGPSSCSRVCPSRPADRKVPPKTAGKLYMSNLLDPSPSTAEETEGSWKIDDD